MAATVQMEPVAQKPYVLSVKGDTSYATGGYALSAAFLDSAVASGVTIVGLNIGTVIALWDGPNKKVKFITAATGAEVANASDQSGNTVKLLVYS